MSSTTTTYVPTYDVIATVPLSPMQYTSRYRMKRHMREPEMEKVHHQIILIVAVSLYCRWKESLQSHSEDESCRIQAELEFCELHRIIETGAVVDGPLLNYVDLLENGGKYDEALKVMLLAEITAVTPMISHDPMTSYDPQ